MKSALWMSCVLALAVGSSLAVFAAEEEAAKVDTKEVMKVAMKDGLCKKVADGKGDKADAEKLLELFSALAANNPPKGDADSWKSKTEALVAAAKACVDGEEGAGAALGKAANCMACHKEHKPPQP